MIKKLLSCFFFLFLLTTAFAEQQRTDVPIGNSPAFGPENAPVTIIEFIDFQ
jgi:hypothetical protein